MILNHSPLQSVEFFSLYAILYYLGPNTEEVKGLCSQGSIWGGSAHLRVRV